MDKTVSDPNFAGMAVFTPVINGEALALVSGGTAGHGFCVTQGSSRQKNLNSERTR